MTHFFRFDEFTVVDLDDIRSVEFSPKHVDVEIGLLTVVTKDNLGRIRIPMTERKARELLDQICFETSPLVDG